MKTRLLNCKFAKIRLKQFDSERVELYFLGPRDGIKFLAILLKEEAILLADVLSRWTEVSE